jgi:hypothetical protein
MAEVGTRLLVEVSVEVVIEHKVDLVLHYTNLTGAQQAAYTEGIGSGGFADWEWPIQFLYPSDDDRHAWDGWMLPSAAVLRTHADERDYSEYVAERPGHERYTRPKWSEKDYRLLCSLVPWMEAVRRHRLDPGDPEALSAEAIARIPGPNDEAMF